MFEYFTLAAGSAYVAGAGIVCDVKKKLSIGTVSMFKYFSSYV
jgi:hypothetical protein